MNTNTEPSIHGHEIMHLITDFGPIPRLSLQAKVEEIYGIGATFHTCSANEMNIDTLLTFLLERGKIQQGPNGLTMHGDAHICENE